MGSDITYLVKPVLVVFGLASLVFGIGLLLRQEWARFFTIVLSTINLLLGIAMMALTFAQLGEVNLFYFLTRFLCSALAVAYQLLVLWFLSPQAHDIFSCVATMPSTMRRLAAVQFFTWLGLFCMWLHFSNAVPVVFGTSDASSDLFKRGAEWAGVCYALKDAVTFIAAFALMAAARKLDRRHVHGLCLTLGGLGLLAIGFIHGEQQKHLLLLALGLGGVAWASILSMPYAILAGALPPQRMGVYMGIFNFFIVLPEIIAALTFGPLVKNLLGGNLVHAVMAGGVFMLIAALLTQWVHPTPASAPASR